jgi:hypothetical protein
LFLSAFLALFVTAAREAAADSVILKNGARIDGKVTDHRETTGHVRVDIGDTGFILLRTGEVARIETGGEGAAAAQPAAAAAKDEARAVEALERSKVRVTVPPGGDFYGDRTYEGVLAPESTAEMLVLEVPGPGKVYIPNSANTTVARAPETAEAAPAAAAGDGVIRTTHRVHLSNGRTLTGNLVETPASEPLKLRIGGMGAMSIPRDKVVSVEQAAGTITLPAAPPAEPAKTPTGTPEEAPAATPAETREQLKRELREEILRELLDRLIEQKIESALPPVGGLGLDLGAIPEGLTNDDVFAIQEAVLELGRQRNTNRVRAENHLRSMGPAVIPFLAPAAAHPFDLTRRAAQRILRDLGDIHGAPLAIARLNDPDQFTRSLAGEALAVMLPSDIRYAADARERDRLTAQAAYHALWDETLRAAARERILAGLAAR